jgi:hypothetical protein
MNGMAMAADMTQAIVMLWYKLFDRVTAQWAKIHDLFGLTGT